MKHRPVAFDDQHFLRRSLRVSALQKSRRVNLSIPESTVLDRIGSRKPSSIWGRKFSFPND
jgi:hypothetical protein